MMTAIVSCSNCCVANVIPKVHQVSTHYETNLTTIIHGEPDVVKSKYHPGTACPECTHQHCLTIQIV